MSEETQPKTKTHKGKDIAGNKYTRLIAIEPTVQRKNGCIVWHCKCNCGTDNYNKDVYAIIADLQQGNTKSCGCLKSEMMREVALKGSKRNKLGYKGITYRKKDNKYCASMMIKGKTYYLGAYNTIEEAIGMRKTAEIEKENGNFNIWYENKCRKNISVRGKSNIFFLPYEKAILISCLKFYIDNNKESEIVSEETLNRIDVLIEKIDRFER